MLVVDRLVNPAILEYARRDAVRIDAGKEPGGPSMAQDEINRILVREALEGAARRPPQRRRRLHLRPCRRGDGRRARRRHSVEVVPGVTAAHACAASVGLPLTLRQKVRQFAVVTGATADGASISTGARWRSRGRLLRSTWACAAPPHLCDSLLAAGAEPETPVVIVENGTLPSERARGMPIGRSGQRHRGLGDQGPAIIFVGLDWAEAGLSRPDKIESYKVVGKGEPGRRRIRVPRRHSKDEASHGADASARRCGRDEGKEALVTAVPLLPRSAPFAPEDIDTLNSVVARTTPLQRSWLAGFFAGFEAAQGGAQAQPQPVAAAQAA